MNLLPQYNPAMQYRPPSTPILSIVVPSFNCATLLPRTIASTDFLIGQIEFEIIVVDDGSTDDTQRLLSELAKTHSHLRGITQPNKGLSGARNTGIASARGTYVFLLDADDEMLPCSLADKFATGVDILRVGVEEVADGVATRLHQDQPQCMSGREYLSAQFATDAFFTPSWAYIYRREWLSLNQLEFVPGLLHEDNLFTIQALMAAKTVQTVPDLVYRYIRREGSITMASGDDKRRKRIAALSYVVRKLVQMANESTDFDLRWKIQEVIWGADAIARQCTTRHARWSVLMIHLRYMLTYWGYDRPALRYTQRHMAMHFWAAAMGRR